MSESPSESFMLFSYNPKDKLSLLKYASHISGHTLREFAEFAKARDTGVDSKGDFGDLVEELYFGYKPNNRAEPDFVDVGVELKTTKLEKKKTLGWDPKERLILNMINYEKVHKDYFNTIFSKKNSQLIVMFYRYVSNQNILDRYIQKVIFWTFTPNELRVMKEDWQKAEDIILDKRAHELHEGGTFILTWAPKGPGHGKGMRSQNGTDVKASPKAIALKNSYVCKMFRQSLDLKDAIAKKVPCRLWDVPDVQNIFEEPWGEDKSFEKAIKERLSPYENLSCDEIEDLTEYHLNRKDKKYYALLANRMLGVKKLHAAEIDDYDITVKIIRLKRNRKCKEYMSFPAFEYCDLVKQEWESSDLKEMLEKEFLFIVFQMTDDKDEDFGKARYRGAFFWTLPEKDVEEVKFVWKDTVNQIRKNDYDDFQAMSNTTVVHVRPHAVKRDTDTSTGLDGKEYPKKSFWLNGDYLSDLVNKKIPDIPMLSTKVKKTEKVGKRRTL